MPLGVLTDAACVALGGIAGSLAKDRVSEEHKAAMNRVLGLCAMGMGISAIGLMHNLPAVVFSVILGTWAGLLVHLGQGIRRSVAWSLRPVAGTVDDEQLLTAVVVFCASGTGIYGALDSGMTGDHSVLLAKAVLDFFTAMVFACKLGKVTAWIAVPQLGVLLCLFYLAGWIVPWTNPVMIGDFKACGGFLLLATGFRMTQIQDFPVADMLPAMVIVMPASYAWMNRITPLLG